MAVKPPTGNIPAGTNAESAHPKGGILPKISIKANLGLGGRGGDAINQLNGRMGGDSQTGSPHRADNAVYNAGDVTDGNNGNHLGQLKNGNNGGNHGHGTQGPQGHGKQGPQGNGNNPPTNTPVNETQNQSPIIRTTVKTAPSITPNGPGKQNPVPTNGQTGNTPPIIANPGNQNHPHGNQHFPQWNPPIIVTTRRNDDDPRHDNRSNHSNHSNNNFSNGQLRNAVVELLRQNDIFVSRSVINDLIGNQNLQGNNRSANIPTEVRQLIQSVVSQLSNTLNSPTSQPNPQFIRQTAAEISNALQPQINSAREILIFTTQPEAKHFGSLNIQERVFLAVEMMFNHLPADTNLQQFSNREVYNGLMLARGLVSSNENTADIRNLVAFKSDALPNGFSPAGLRDLGQLVKVLVADTVNAKTTANLDLAVQKFIKILVANNELGVLLSAAALAKQAEAGTLSMNRTLALVQIYQLITRLILAGEAALKDAAAKNALPKSENNLSASGLNKITDVEEKSALLRDLQNNNLHSSLKNFLEFNPAFVSERTASSFVSAEDARHAQQHFASHHADEIEQWLNGGNHRFVKEIELDKPIGVVVERGAEDFFAASKARIVLVRDSSAQGWHFLKSFLVK